MSVEINPVQDHLKQLADKFLEIRPDEKGPFDNYFRYKIGLNPPIIQLFDQESSVRPRTITYTPNARREEEVFFTLYLPGAPGRQHGGTGWPSLPGEIKLLIDVLDSSDKIDPILLETVKGSARIRLFSMRMEIDRILKEI